MQCYLLLENIFNVAECNWQVNLKLQFFTSSCDVLAELETKRILLEAFKERQQKNAQSGTLPTFYKKVLFEIILCF